MVRSAVDRAFLPAKSLFEQVGDMVILTARTIGSAVRPALSLWRGVHRPVPLRAAALLVSAADLHRGDQLWRAGSAGGELPLPARRARSARRLLRPRRDSRNRAIRDRRRRRRSRRHRDHRRSRRPQDPRGARRSAGARRRPDQEPGRAALSGADADHRPARHLRPGLRAQRRHPHRDPLPPVAGRLLCDPLLQRLGHRPLGLGDQVHAVWRDHRHRLLLQGNDRLGRCGRGRPRRQRGGGDLLPGVSSPSTTPSPRRLLATNPELQTVR